MPRARLASLVSLCALIAGTALAQTPPPPPPPAPKIDSPSTRPSDSFGEEVQMPERTIVFVRGHGTWDVAFESLIAAFKQVNEYLEKEKIARNGMALTIYTQTDDSGFSFNAAWPVAAAPATPPPGDIAVGQSPSGKALKFVHRGSFDAMDTTYEAITNFLDQKGLDAKELFIEEYVTDPTRTDQEKLVVNVYVPIK
jgi:effector-binding domain-containing protein